MTDLKLAVGCLLFARTLIGLSSPFDPGTSQSVLKLAIVIFNSVLFMLLQMLQAVVNVLATMDAFAFMCLKVVLILPMTYGLRNIPAPPTVHVAALKVGLFFDVVYFPSL